MFPDPDTVFDICFVFNFKLPLLVYICVHECACVCMCVHMVVRGQLAGVS